MLDLVLEVDVAVGDAVRKLQVIHRFDVLQVHRHALETVRDLASDRIAVEAADLLEVRELRDLHAVEPHFPAQPPCAERRIFPIIFDETHVVFREIEAELGQ